MRKFLVFVLLCGFCLSLFACAPAETGKTPLRDIESTVEYLASAELAGRRLGTEGNEKAAAAIKTSFREIGLLPFEGEDFGLKYTQENHVEFEKGSNIIEGYKDGAWETLVLGEDFFPYINFTPIKGEFSLLPADTNTDVSSRAVLLDSGLYDSSVTETMKPAIFLEVSEMLTVRPDMNPVPSIRVTQAGHDKLKGAEKLRLDLSAEIGETEAENVVGLVQGTKPSMALIISAHFDHVGGVGTHMVPGGHDNASGVAVLLEIARQLAAKEETPAVDIVFCAFNGEENAQQGSAAVVALLKEKYDKLWNLNIDCVGSPVNPQTYMVSRNDENDPAAKAMEFKLLRFGREIEKTATMLSDDVSFFNGGFCSFTVGQDSIKIHVPQDDGRELDFGEMKELADFLAAFAWENAGREFEASPGVGASSSVYSQEDINAAFEKALDGHELAVDEEIYLELGGSTYVLTGARYMNDIDEINEHFPKLQIPESLNGLPLEAFCVSPSSGIQYTVFEELEPALSTISPGATIGEITKRTMELTERDFMFLSYRLDTRVISILAYPRNGYDRGTPWDGEEKLDGDYEGITFAYMDDIDKPRYRYMKISLKTGAHDLLIETCDNERMVGEDGMEFYFPRDLGNDTKENMMALAELLKTALIERGLY